MIRFLFGRIKVILIVSCKNFDFELKSVIFCFLTRAGSAADQDKQ